MNIDQIKYSIERGVRYENGDIIGVNGQPLKPRLGGVGYRVVGLPTVTVFQNEYVHKLVYYFETGDERAFDPTFEIHHKNQVRHDNRFENLELMKSELHESMSSKNNRRNAKINFQIAEAIRLQYETDKGVSQRRLAEIYGLSQQHISDIIRNKKWLQE